MAVDIIAWLTIAATLSVAWDYRAKLRKFFID
jgi:hypothetical protein